MSGNVPRRTVENRDGRVICAGRPFAVWVDRPRSMMVVPTSCACQVGRQNRTQDLSPRVGYLCRGVPAEWSWEVSVESLSQRLFEALTNGDRPSARAIVDESFRDGASAEQIVSELFWPTYEQIENLFREDKLTTLAHHMATRLLRSLCDQAAQRFSFKNPIGRSVFAVCGPRASRSTTPGAASPTTNSSRSSRPPSPTCC